MGGRRRREAGFARLVHAWGDPRAEPVSTLGLARPGGGEAEVVVTVGESRTFAEMALPEKNAIFHRARAFAALRRLLR